MHFVSVQSPTFTRMLHVHCAVQLAAGCFRKVASFLFNTFRAQKYKYKYSAFLFCVNNTQLNKSFFCGSQTFLKLPPSKKKIPGKYFRTITEIGGKFEGCLKTFFHPSLKRSSTNCHVPSGRYVTRRCRWGAYQIFWVYLAYEQSGKEPTESVSKEEAGRWRRLGGSSIAPLVISG